MAQATATAEKQTPTVPETHINSFICLPGPFAVPTVSLKG